MYNESLTNSSKNATSQFYGTEIGLFFILEFFGAVPTVFGNALILISLKRFKKLRKRGNILLGNLAIADFAVGFVLIPLEMIWLLVPSVRESRYMCLWRLSFRVVILGASIFSLSAICVERYIAIRHPFQYQTHVTKRKLLTAAVIIWVVALTFAAMPLVGWNQLHNEFNVSCLLWTIWTLEYKITLNGIMIGFLVIDIVLYAAVMKKACTYVRSHKSKMNPETSKTKFVEIPRTKMMGIAFGLFAVLWSPHCFVILISAITGITSVVVSVQKVTLCIAAFNSCVNWIVYGLLNRDFRYSFQKVLGCTKSQASSLTITET